jgi:uncharacterized membrane protein YgcG
MNVKKRKYFMLLLKGPYENLFFLTAPYSERLCGKHETAVRLALCFHTVKPHILITNCNKALTSQGTTVLLHSQSYSIFMKLRTFAFTFCVRCPANPHPRGGGRPGRPPRGGGGGVGGGGGGGVGVRWRWCQRWW